MGPPFFTHVSVADQQFFSILEHHFTKGMGPLAEIVIEDEIRDMGEVPQSFPCCRAADLIRFLSYHIPHRDNRIRFLTVMSREIQKRHMEGYC